MPNHAKSILTELFNTHLHVPLDFIENGETFHTGHPFDQEAKVIIEIKDSGFYKKLLRYGNLGLGETYMNNGFKIVKGKLEEFIEVLLAGNLEQKLKNDLLLKLKIFPFRMHGWWQSQGSSVRHHYDNGMDLFYSFLDPSLTYSCGYAVDEKDSLAQLQINKFHRICEKLRLREEHELLDIGAGYGGMLIYAAEHYGIRGVGITNSQNHFEIGNRLIEEKKLNDRIKLQLGDFKQLNGRFDKIVSIGMLEHVPRSQHSTYFSSISRLLKEKGMGLLHCVGANAANNRHDYFIQKYIFPMSNQPRLSEISLQLEKNGLPILDVENMIRHYGYTAQHWLDNFRLNRSSLTKYSNAYLNMFEYYLACCVAAAKASDAALYQVLFTRSHTDYIPLRRV